MSIRIGIFGYGNLGRGVECAVRQNPDLELAAVFTRRAPESVSILTEGVPVYHADEAAAHREEIDVMILCGGSATDLPVQTPALASLFNVVDSFDTHAKIPEHFARVDEAAKKSGKVGIISVGWDPGMFSLNRLYANAVLPQGSDYTFWGKGVSQGHSDAIRRINGVLDARQYTIPVEDALKSVRSGENPELTTREKHTRECFVVAEEGADLSRIENEIKTMPNYFADYDTTVHFISMDELKREHSGIPHGGFVIRSGKTGWNEENSHIIEYSLKLDSNPEFTASVIVAYARAAYRMSQNGESGCKTVFDVAPAMLSARSGEELRAHLL
ncbi:MAG: diaminopimelate dehydrogenase [Oscillospiraceae bacterium]|nr:diaminopimelate dehydrogenase [Oscillospiraceae bacterium]MDY3064415.1 diaminopimelate dehydrogenase [Oscillospiraceae bacterium]